MQGLQTDEEVEAYLDKLKDSVSSVEAVLHRTTAPNLKALEKMREVKDKLQGVTEGKFNVKPMSGGLSTVLEADFCDIKSRICNNTEF